MNYFLSPELHRNLWLKFSPLRLLAVPLIYGIVVIITLNVSIDKYNEVNEILMNLSLSAFYICVIIWGSYEATTALHEEMKSKTWDQQRMSSITPAKLAFGKLFGATSYAWYAGLLALGVFAWCFAGYDKTGTTRVGNIQQAVSLAPTAKEYFFCLVYLVASGVFGHAVGFLASFSDMAGLQARGARGKLPQTVPFLVLAIFAAHFVFSGLGNAMVRHSTHEKTPFDRMEFYNWFGMPLAPEIFVTGSLAFFLGWALIGIYRIARAELMYRVTPVVWMVFATTISLYFAGMVSTETKYYSFSISALVFVILTGFTYISMVTESHDIGKYSRLIDRFRRGQFARAFENTPKWVSTLPLMIVAYAAALGAYHSVGTAEKSTALFSLMTSFILFAARDGLVIHAIHLSAGSSRHQMFKRGFYYLLVYALIPALHFTSIGGAIDFSDMLESSFSSLKDEPGKLLPNVSSAVAYYYPSAFSNPLKSILPPLIEMGAAGYWLFICLKRK